ncbi:alpha-L-fucosidase [Paraflavitalea sp. CAU 1676]|uniref:alpha-L-fucosidase n=1 Tax=Paraflavitalea sp. CAU 1676 TaxID=3032598 RepID=UPI0023DB6FAB|nr:alpha-L-fucosidase [Paraflavitalea sp. CAU 1676]MDF2190630.1 alpha-L-fucosidase [Paraflavitalea sp. CAU 1676]
MKKLLSLFIPGIVLATTAYAQPSSSSIGYKPTIPVSATDTHDDIIRKAAHVIPTANQYAALRNEFIAFIHFGPNSFTRLEWGNGKEDPRIFDLKELHTDQWCQAMKAAGMKMVILTVKHHDGFVLWQSRYTNHGIMSTGFRNGKGDVLKELTASCAKYGLKVGIYLSPADLFQIESADGLYGNLSKYTQRTIPRAVSGRPFANKTTFQFEVDDYNEYFLNQLFELLTEYGPVHEVWFDGAHPKTKGGQRYNYQAWRKLIHALAPKAVIFGKEDIRWCGNEAGRTRPTEWNVIPYATNPDTLGSFGDLTQDDLGSREKLYSAQYLHYQQAETNTSIREGWFYRDDEAQQVRSADDVFDIYERSVGGNSTFLLNIPPNRLGKFSPADVACLEETGRRIRATYGVNLLKGAKGPVAALDNSATSFAPVNIANPEIIITTPKPVTINRFVLQEAISTRGESVEEHTVDAWINGQWQQVASATNIGYKRILRFPDVTAAKFRVRFTQYRTLPSIANITAHYYKSRPPRLQASRDNKGMVTIEPMREAFSWKPHGENAAANLATGLQIYYTTDGTEPTVHSTHYTAPFPSAQANIKAVAFIKDQRGAVTTTRLGIIKNNWKIEAADSETPNHKGGLAIDAKDNTWWQSADGEGPHFITIDLGHEHPIRGFAYTPPVKAGTGLLAKGIIRVSTDGKVWKDAGSFEFGNLVNDPTMRYHALVQPQAARYVRIEATELAGNNRQLSIAELDIFE